MAANGNRVPIPGTQREVWPSATPVADVGSGDVFLTAWLRPRRGGALDIARARALGAAPPKQRSYDDRANLIERTGADPADLDAFSRYCSQLKIDVVASHWRSVIVSAPIDRLIDAFGATAAICELPDKRRFRHRSGSLHASPEIAEMLTGLFGIHQWPRSHAIGALHGHTVAPSPRDTASRYSFPDADGSGQTIAILQLRGAFRADDFASNASAQGIAAQTPIVKRVDNAELEHGIETDKDVESAMDTQIVAAFAPGAQIVIYAAPDDARGVLDAIRKAIFDTDDPSSILSISFGYPERLWTPAALTILDELFTAAALLGISVFCAAGDNGAELDENGNPHVLAPASCEFVHACGGTEIAPDGTTEAAWAKTGGGFSAVHAAPPWQTAVPALAAQYKVRAGRGIPDFAAEVMPGYPICFEGTQMAAGGTSAIAPLWSALTARINQRLGKAVGFFAPFLYGAAPGLFREIRSGANDRFSAGPGWNPCSGLGVPIGDAIERALGGS